MRARHAGVTDVRLRSDGALVVHANRPGYGQVIHLAGRAADIVGLCVRVITDDVPAAEGAQPL